MSRVTKWNRRNDILPFSIWLNLESSFAFTHTYARTITYRAPLTVQQKQALPKIAAESRSFRSRGLISHEDPYPALLPRAHYLLLARTRPFVRSVFLVSFRSETPRGKTAEGLPARFRAVLEGGKRKEPLHCFVCGSRSTRRWPR